MQRARPAALALLIGLLAAPPVPGASAQVVPAFGLAFASDRGSSFDIYAVGVASVGERVVVGTGRHEHDPAWSPDGARLAFARVTGASSAIVVTGADGTGEQAITSGPGRNRQPAWSPDGSRIAFVHSSSWSGTSRIRTIRAGGGDAKLLTTGGRGRRDAAPAWSPDGSRIAFASARKGLPPDIFVMNADGSRVRRLTENRAVDANPSWSPDGSRIVFERCCPGGSSDIMVMDVSGSGVQNLTRSPEHEYDPAWSPDGEAITFVATSPEGGDRDIYTMAADGSARTRITLDGRADLSPAWRPVGACALEPCSVFTVPVDEVASVPTTSPAAAGTGADYQGRRRITQRRRRIVPGVKLIRVRHRRPERRVFALLVDPRKKPAISVALAGGRLAGTSRTRAIAKAHRALAAVNGDFALPGGSPVHAFLGDGAMKRTTLSSGANFAVTRDERRAFAGRPRVSTALVQADSGDAFPVDRWNDGEPVVGEIAAYSPAGRSVAAPPRGACAARLKPTSAIRWAEGRTLLRQTYKVGWKGCRVARPRLRGGVVLAAPAGTPEGLLLSTLAVGSQVRMSWTIGWEGVHESIGGTPVLVRRGRAVVGACSSSLCYRHPRTAVGVTGKGKILLVVVDGRRRKWSVGMTLKELAREMIRLGARHAVNLDGGGSSTMVLRGKILNRPSDGSERAVSSAVLVLRRRPRTAVQAEPTTEPTRSGASEDSILDPASTGGLLEALSEGALGPQMDLPVSLDRALRRFLAAR